MVERAPASSGYQAALIIAIRAERPMGAFDGAMAAVIPLSVLQPNTHDRALPAGSDAAIADSRDGFWSPAILKPSS